MNKQIMVMALAILTIFSISGSETIEKLSFPCENENQTAIPEGFFPEIYIDGENMILCTEEGVFSTSLSDLKWDLYSLEGKAIEQFVSDGNQILAIEIQGNGKRRLIKIDKDEILCEVDLDIKSEFGEPEIFHVANNPLNKNEIIVGFHQYPIYRSSDFGKTWTKGWGGSDKQTRIAFSPYQDGVVLSSYWADYGWRNIDYSPGEDKWYGLDSFDNFTTFEDEGLNRNYSIVGFTFDSRAKDTAWFSGNGFIGKVEYDGSLLYPKCLKGQLQWIESRDAIIPKVIIDPENIDFLYAPAVVPSKTEGESNKLTIYFSGDGGATWVKDQTSDVPDDCVLMYGAAQSGRDIYMYTNGGGLYRYEMPEKRNAIEELTVNAPSVVFEGNICAYKVDGQMNLKIYNPDGRETTDYAIEGDNIVTLNLDKGLYVYSITDKSGKVRKSGKVIIK